LHSFCVFPMIYVLRNFLAFWLPQVAVHFSYSLHFVFGGNCQTRPFLAFRFFLTPFFLPFSFFFFPLRPSFFALFAKRHPSFFRRSRTPISLVVLLVVFPLFCLPYSFLYFFPVRQSCTFPAPRYTTTPPPHTPQPNTQQKTISLSNSPVMSPSPANMSAQCP